MVKFTDKDFELDVRTDSEHETVWLSIDEMSTLFQRERTVISRHIKNVFLDKEASQKSNVHFLHIPNSDKPVAFYSLDVII